MSKQLAIDQWHKLIGPPRSTQVPGHGEQNNSATLSELLGKRKGPDVRHFFMKQPKRHGEQNCMGESGNVIHLGESACSHRAQQGGKEWQEQCSSDREETDPESPVALPSESAASLVDLPPELATLPVFRPSRPSISPVSSLC
ncbi:uncharacterized protein LOC121881857 isoform X2 [Thunnus maccoyii]|uniref:uncharacterized protein LOC121881857 isoform X2 n=1 Tax=Thunnus maccoyii TaxID=8240 RepID=UPI001C4BC3B3|nr:uncharacterized protein LOC121881857 isoform X2 [Thunnus maccoyii]